MNEVEERIKNEIDDTNVDLSGFKVCKRNYKRGRPSRIAMYITTGSSPYIGLSVAASEKIAETRFVRIMFNPYTKQLVVKPTSKSDPAKIKVVLIPRTKTIRWTGGRAPELAQELGLDPTKGYTFYGKYLDEDGLLLFQVPKEA